jgi:hypothetical protein
MMDSDKKQALCDYFMQFIDLPPLTQKEIDMAKQFELDNSTPVTCTAEEEAAFFEGYPTEAPST